MKILKMALLTLILTVGFASCKKGHDQVATQDLSLEELYPGKFGIW